jgi:hypothetical protein
MIPFITFRETNIDGGLSYYILQKAHPHYIGEIIQYPKEHNLCNMPLPQYNLWISYEGVLEGRFIPGYKEVENDIDSIFAQMAEWFYKNRILATPKKYIKFKFNDTITRK